MHRYLWLFPVLAVMCIAGGLIATREPSKAAMIAPAPLPLPVIAKTKTRNVYDGTTKVGELTFTIQKYTSANVSWIKLVAGSMVFEVTNDTYKTQANPFPAVQSIPLVDGAEDELEALGERGGCNIGDVTSTDDPWFAMSLSFIDDAWTWNDFFTDPTDYTNARVWVWYHNTARAGGSGDLELVTKEETP